MKQPRHVFVSYSERDRRIVERILQRLTTRLQTGSGREIDFWDQRQIVPGGNWAAELGQAMERADAMLVFISPHYLSSQWARYEIDFALSSPRFEGRLIPVLLKPSPDLPWILERLALVDATKNLDSAAHQIAKALQSAEVVRS